jgi:hypothetical protein
VDSEEFRRRAIRAALMVTGIAVVIGLVVGGLTAGAVYVTGLGSGDEATQELPDPSRDDQDDEALPTPSLSPTASPTQAPPSEGKRPKATEPAAKDKRKPRRRQPLTLQAGSARAGTFQRITLSGRYPGGNGTSLQVQRREGGSWARFPTSAGVRGGTFSTYVASGQSGPNAFRVIDPATGRASNVVVVNIS